MKGQTGDVAGGESSDRVSGMPPRKAGENFSGFSLFCEMGWQEYC